jgi:hypothetical protein
MKYISNNVSKLVICVAKCSQPWLFPRLWLSSTVSQHVSLCVKSYNVALAAGVAQPFSSGFASPIFSALWPCSGWLACGSVSLWMAANGGSMAWRKYND